MARLCPVLGRPVVRSPVWPYLFSSHNPETHGSDDAKEGELKDDREREYELVDAVDFQEAPESLMVSEGPAAWSSSPPIRLKVCHPNA